MAEDFPSDSYTGALDKYCQENKADVNYHEVSKTGPPHDLRSSYIHIFVQDKTSKGVEPTTQKANQLATNLTQKQMVLEQTSKGDDPAPPGSSPAVSSDYRSNSSMLFGPELPSENAISASESERNDNSESFTSSSSSSMSYLKNTVEKKGFMKDFSEITLIGSGGYGQVFKARDRHDGKIYAIKCVKYARENRETVEREAEVLAKLDHPNIVHYYSSWAACYIPVESDQKRSHTVFFFFIQMEFCDKGTLEQWIDDRRGKTPNKYLALGLFMQIVEGVSYIHSQGFIHGDLTPSNIFLAATNQIKIGDLGLITFQNPDAKWTSERGTPGYTSPEQLLSPKYGTAEDITDLGVILAQLLYISRDRWEIEEIFEDLRNGHDSNVFDDKENILLQNLLSKDRKILPDALEIQKTVKEWMTILEKKM